jgi:hypothetical protein
MATEEMCDEDSDDYDRLVNMCMQNLVVLESVESHFESGITNQVM